MINGVGFIFIMCMLQACSPDPNPVPAITITNNLLSFSATNLSDENKTKVNSTDEDITFNWNINFDINGNKSSYSGTSNKNVLPVLAGNEIEVTFKPTTNQNETTFTLPDGTTRKITKVEPSFKWIVPQTIKTGDQITGESTYRDGDVASKSTGRILFEVVE
ncbi:MAG: hypothetical protein J5996_02150 [Prevotella sp.]|nr:hypothetical protein [Prevotella sp.]